MTERRVSGLNAWEERVAINWVGTAAGQASSGEDRELSVRQEGFTDSWIFKFGVQRTYCVDHFYKCSVS